MTHIQPMRDRLVLQRIKEERLIVLTDAEPSRKFLVLAAGPKCKEVKPGDLVRLPGQAAIEPDHWVSEDVVIVCEGDVGGWCA